jgi:hypothetical protein
MINQFLQHRLADRRYASYDFCYLYFQTNKGNLGGANMENSCMHLWSYLASWGMLRGSSALLQCSPSVLKELIKYFDDISHSIIWTVDVDTYAPESKEEILNVYDGIAKILKNSITKTLGTEIKNIKVSVTLVTKIMLGVFGCVPAIDQYFYKTFHGMYKGFGKLGSKELDALENFYKKRKPEIDSFQIPVLDFTGKNTNLQYKKAKIIDMYGFIDGFSNSQKKH